MNLNVDGIDVIHALLIYADFYQIQPLFNILALYEAFRIKSMTDNEIKALFNVPHQTEFTLQDEVNFLTKQEDVEITNISESQLRQIYDLDEQKYTDIHGRKNALRNKITEINNTTTIEERDEKRKEKFKILTEISKLLDDTDYKRIFPRSFRLKYSNFEYLFA